MRNQQVSTIYEDIMSVKETNFAPTRFRTIERPPTSHAHFNDFGIGRGLGRVPAANDPISWTRAPTSRSMGRPGGPRRPARHGQERRHDQRPKTP
jgi:hypothetical protein